MNKLSDQQIQAVRHFQGPMLVLAGPGSGKTRVITYRIQHLIENCKVQPQEILVVTFTRAAAREMKERFLYLTGNDHTLVSFGTFHSIFFGILKHAYGFSASQIVRPEQQYECLRTLIRKYRLEIEDEGEFISDLLGEISRVRNARISLAGYHASCCTTSDFIRLYEGYENWRQKERLVDFDDMMVYCYELFSQRQDILDAWRGKYRYILVDEFQDINQLQYDILCMLARPSNNLFIVGDDDQSIYGFRGSKPELMKQFLVDFPGAKQVLLDRNYRSTFQIVETSLRVIGQNENRFKKKLITDKVDGPPVLAHVFSDQEEEWDCIADKIRIYGEKGGNYSDIAVLLRVNTQGTGLVEKLMERNIPFQLKDRMPNLYEHWIAKHIFAYVRMALGSRSRQDFLLVMNRPKRYINRDALEESEVCFEELYKLYDDKPWVVERIEKLESDIRIIARMKPFGALHYIRYVVGYEDYLKEYAEYRGIKAEEFLEIYEQIQEQSKRFSTFQEWFSYVEEYQAELRRQAKERERKREGVVLTTMHGSKGLEYRIVFLIDVNEGVIPHKKAVLPEEIEEERRLFYVAMTRARELLYVFAVKERHGKKQDVSRFYQEMGAEKPAL